VAIRGFLAEVQKRQKNHMNEKENGCAGGKKKTFGELNKGITRVPCPQVRRSSSRGKKDQPNRLVKER